MIKYILFLISYRLCIDFIYPNDKPLFIQLVYFVLAFGFVFFSLRFYKAKDMILVILLIAVTSYSYLYSYEVFMSQFIQNTKIILPILILISASRIDIDFHELRMKAKRFLHILVFLLLIYFFSDFEYFEIYDAFTNNPVHAVSQSIAKISILYLMSNPFLSYIFLSMLFILNVRSNFLPIFFLKIRQISTNWPLIVKILGLLCIVFLLINSTEFIDRFIFKGRTSDDQINDFSSGRIEVYLLYLDYIRYNFSFYNYLFGSGSLFLQQKLALSGHNDILNTFIEFGIVGSVIVYWLYYEVSKSIDKTFYWQVVLYFLFVFITNGLLFHQSNLIFLLYLGREEITKKRTIEMKVENG